MECRAPRPAFSNACATPASTPRTRDEQRLNKSLLMFATGLVSVASMLWLVIYWQPGAEVLGDAAVRVPDPAGHQPRALHQERQLQLLPRQPAGAVPVLARSWCSGASATSSRPAALPSGACWPRSAPSCVIGVRESLAWFIAYIFLLALSGFFDYYLADLQPTRPQQIPLQTSMVFFALNFSAVSTIVLPAAALLDPGEAEGAGQADGSPSAAADRAGALGAPAAQHPARLRSPNGSRTATRPSPTVSPTSPSCSPTSSTSPMSPKACRRNQVFAMLNRIFSSFDELAEQFGLEKIKTIGDAYMVAGGLERGARGLFALPSPTWRSRCATCCAATSPSTRATSKSASASAPARSSPAWSARRSSSTTFGATPSISPAASPAKACPA